MAVLKTAARPWVKAAAALPVPASAPASGWAGAFEALAVVGRDRRVVKALRRADADGARALLNQLAGEFLWESPVALVLELKDRGQLSLLPFLPELWQEMEEARSGLREVLVTLPYALKPSELQALTAYLEQKFRCRLQPRTVVDPSLLGGYVAQVGDRVWDATVHGSLDRLKNDILWDREIENAAERP